MKRKRYKITLQRPLSPHTHTDENTGENKSTGEESKKWQTPKHKAAHTVRIFQFFSRISSLNSVVSFRHTATVTDVCPLTTERPLQRGWRLYREGKRGERGERNRIRLRESAEAKRKRSEKESSPAAYSHCLLLPNCFCSSCSSKIALEFAVILLLITSNSAYTQFSLPC